ncbi:hypothetical protein PV08_03468 [Exophiala spinifera]|uniref:TLC domain-containing protein n=1 Tax=Exophiala spinifera TaxID=91928 RepID=A0A0D2BKQ5_9EURO|nr:uncharacterized protein PV08_03468 [Exophiala spinifera]KIW19175.1 hypothetical protein PV08_03468 [Exophiala spinifera]
MLSTDGGGSVPLDPMTLHGSFTRFCLQYHLASLPLHVHQVLIAFLTYEVLFLIVAPAFSLVFLPQTYGKLPRRTKTNWNVRVTSFIQATFICYQALRVITQDTSRQNTDYDARLWAYSRGSGDAQAFAAGYFLWDVVVSVQHFQILGPTSLIHALSALMITSLGFRPFANFYGVNFVLYELSTPFLNIHWFLDKLGKAGGRYQLWNGICLIITFFGCRLVWGTYQTINLMADTWRAWGDVGTGKCLDAFMTVRAEGSQIAVPVQDFCYDNFPSGLLLTYIISNTLLSGLNVYWFGLMLKALGRRFNKNVDKKQE